MQNEDRNLFELELGLRNTTTSLDPIFGVANSHLSDEAVGGGKLGASEPLAVG